MIWPPIRGRREPNVLWQKADIASGKAIIGSFTQLMIKRDWSGFIGSDIGVASTGSDEK